MRHCLRLMFTAAMIGLIVILSCSDSGTKSEESEYSGITETHETGEVISTDPDDWGCMDSIFQSEPDSGAMNLVPSQFCFGPAYPNPADDATIIPVTVPIKCFVKVYVTDGDGFRLDLLNDTLTPGIHNLAWDCSTASTGIYRAFLEADLWDCYGDVQIQ